MRGKKGSLLWLSPELRTALFDTKSEESEPEFVVVEVWST